MEDVEPAGPLEDLRQHPLDALRVEEVDDDGVRLLAQLGAELGQPVLGAVDEHDRRAGGEARRAQARPMPEAAPVIATTLPFRDSSMGVSSGCSIFVVGLARFAACRAGGERRSAAGRSCGHKVRARVTG